MTTPRTHVAARSWRTIWASFIGLAGLAALAALFVGTSHSSQPTAAGATSTPPPTRPGDTSEEQLASLHVRVNAPDGRSPVFGARAALAKVHATGAPFDGTSTPKGIVRFEGIEPGRYALRVEHEHYAPQVLELTLTAGRLDLALNLAQGGTAEGRVLDVRGAPVAGAVLDAALEGSVERARQALSSADGSFVMHGLPLGQVALTVNSRAHRRETLRVRFDHHGQRQTVLVRLSAGERISGRVLDPEHRPVAGARVGSSDSGSHFVRTNEHGEFTLTGLGHGPIRIFATAAGFVAARSRNVEPGTQALELVLGQPARLRGRLALPPAVEVVDLSLCHEDSYFRRELCVKRQRFRTPADSYELELLPAGEYELVAEVEGHEAQRIPVRLEAGVTTEGPELSWSAR
ncbi:MAG TPA: carboxypeptidase-like regulatory domain-containing protein [Polyangiaceae bacterium]